MLNWVVFKSGACATRAPASHAAIIPTPPPKKGAVPGVGSTPFFGVRRREGRRLAGRLRRTTRATASSSSIYSENAGLPFLWTTHFPYVHLLPITVDGCVFVDLSGGFWKGPCWESRLRKGWYCPKTSALSRHRGRKKGDHTRGGMSPLVRQVTPCKARFHLPA